MTKCAGQDSGDLARDTGAEARGSRGPATDLLKAVTAVNGQTCTIMASPASGPGQNEVNVEALFGAVDSLPFVFGRPLSAMWSGIVNGLPGCSAPSAKELAVAFVTTIPLPKPAPYIAPGYAITGLASFLETRASEQERFSQETPLGPLEVVTTRTSYDVDWGDGTGRDRGPHPYPGLPWPAGRITHTYTDMGRYGLTVTEHWTASWSLAGESGRITGLRSAPARIDDFQVTQLQAVRNR